MMRLSDFDYHLPPELIAQEPLAKRDASRMLVVHRKDHTIEDRSFPRIIDYLQPGDVIVVNDSQVIPARLVGERETGGRIEILLLEPVDNHQRWEALLKPGRRIRPGTRILFHGAAEAVVNERLTDRKWLISFTTEQPFAEFLASCGTAPLPPYIKRKGGGRRTADLERYQTVYASRPGSIAAPTAGFHFTQEILNHIEQKGVVVTKITLHVGYGTFRPIATEEIEKHIMEPERFTISAAAATAVNTAKRIVAVGTTVVRALESAVDDHGYLRAGEGKTDLYIYPGYRFKRVDTLLTNFHLPRSSLYLLACAFAGKDVVERAYRHAIGNRYRFYSYGDCMLIV
ncbi:MAG: tRNA preQ1(34) S-adenosylmethionine ribosyltransferase-isomerase QueA [Syntrophales bacterium]|nr:tRNA preQ1(34) S-adenosylmethionine ribosyltransferase-isomerase QueA [Syntrophales bacterium]